MPRSYWEVTAIERTRRLGTEPFEFVVSMDGPPGVFMMLMPIDGILRYREFQRVVLAKLGVIYANVVCEGRSEEGANENWREFMETLMAKPAAPATATAAKPPTANPAPPAKPSASARDSPPPPAVTSIAAIMRPGSDVQGFAAAARNPAD